MLNNITNQFSESEVSGGGGGTLVSINGDVTPAQAITTGTAGSDFAVSNPGGGSHVLNLPTASATNRGALSSADWSTFNSKGSGTILGSIADNQVAVGSSANTISGSNNFKWDRANSVFTVLGGQLIKRTATASNYAVLINDYLIAVTDTSAARTVTLPSAITASVGKLYVVKDESGASGTNNITLTATAGNIDGSSTQLININYGSMTVYSDGSNWFIA